jgi:hypothetical protein
MSRLEFARHGRASLVKEDGFAHGLAHGLHVAFDFSLVVRSAIAVPEEMKKP